MRGLLSWGSYLPYRRLDRTTIAAVAGGGGGKGTRTVASYDEDTTTMGVEAARLALRAAPERRRRATLWFATVAPAYLDKTNATAVHAALRLGRGAPAVRRRRLGALRRSARCAPRSARDGAGARRRPPTCAPACPVAPTRRPAATARPRCSSATTPTARCSPSSSAWQSSTEEFLDRWRTPGDTRSKLWEERFGETRYIAPRRRGVGGGAEGRRRSRADQVDHLVVTGTHDRAAARGREEARRRRPTASSTTSAATVGNTGAAAPGAAAGRRARAAHARPDDRAGRRWPTAPT